MFIEQNSGPGEENRGHLEEVVSGTKCSRVPTNHEVAERLVSVEEQVEQAGRRILQDVFTEAQATYWQRRADEFEDARAKPGDYQPPHLQVSEEERAQRDRDLAETALACRRRAQFIRTYGDPEATYMVALAVCDPLSAENRDEERRAA